MSSPLLPLLFAAAYAVLAWQAWQGGSLALVQDVLHAAKPWPDASLLAAMFQDKTLAALAWLHLLMLDFLTARCVCRGGGTACSAGPRRRAPGMQQPISPLHAELVAAAGAKTPAALGARCVQRAGSAPGLSLPAQHR